MDAAYLQSTVGPLLSTAITATLQQRPIDPITFVAHFLLHHSHLSSSTLTHAHTLSAQLHADDAAHSAASATRTATLARAADAARVTAAHAAALSAFLATHSDRATLLPAFLPLLAPIIGSPSIYIARAECSASVDPAGALDSLTFVAALPPTPPTLLTTRTHKPDGVLYDLLAEREAEEEEAEPAGDGGEAVDGTVAAPKPPKPYPTLWVPNVLMGEVGARVKFFGKPRPGSLYAVRVDLPTVRCEEAMEDVLDKMREREERRKEEEEEAKRKAEEKGDGEGEGGEGGGGGEGEEEEEEEEVDEEDEAAVAARAERSAAKEAAKEAARLNPPKVETAEERAEREDRERREREAAEEAALQAAVAKRTIPLIFAFDTLAQEGSQGKEGGKVMGEEEREEVGRRLREVEAAWKRLDVADFREQREAYAAFIAWHKAKEEGGGEGEGGVGGEGAAEEKEAIKKERKGAGLACTAQDVEWVWCGRRLRGVREGLELMRKGEVVRGGGVEGYAAAVRMVGMEVGDWEGRVEWAGGMVGGGVVGVRELMGEEWWSRVEGYDVRGDEDDPKWAEVKRLMARVGGGGGEVGGGKNGVGRVVGDWVKAGLAVRARVRRERREEKERLEREERERREKEEEEERKRKEDEEAAKEAAGEGEAEEGGEEEEEES